MADKSVINRNPAGPFSFAPRARDIATFAWPQAYTSKDSQTSAPSATVVDEPGLCVAT